MVWTCAVFGMYIVYRVFALFRHGENKSAVVNLSALCLSLCMSYIYEKPIWLEFYPFSPLNWAFEGITKSVHAWLGGSV